MHITGGYYHNLDRIALFLDVDGTLLEFGPSPQAVIAPDRLVQSLARVETALGGALALVSGRSIGDLDRMFRPMRFRASGVHGAEFRLDPKGPAVIEAPTLPDRIRAKINAILADFPGALAEDKGFSIAVHYRLAPLAAGPLREALSTLIGGEAALELELLEGRLVYDLKSRGFDKGAAIRRFMAVAPFVGRAPIFVGDDVTDGPALAAVEEMDGVGYAVGTAHPQVAERFATPAKVRQWLEGFETGRAYA